MLLAIGVYFDHYDNDNLFTYSNENFEPCSCFLDAYHNLPQKCQNELCDATYNRINYRLIEIASIHTPRPCVLKDMEKAHKEWISNDTSDAVHAIANSKYLALEDTADLFDAQRFGYISGVQCYLRFKQLTLDYSIEQFKDILKCYLSEDLPLSIQWYVASRIIDLHDFNRLIQKKHTYEEWDLRITHHISEIRHLIEWFDDNIFIKDIVKLRVKRKVVSMLDDDDKWKLFEDGIIDSPGENNIRLRLEYLYNERFYYHVNFDSGEKLTDYNHELLKYECFQQKMCEDFCNCDDFKMRRIIFRYLTDRSQSSVVEKCTGMERLYFWLRNPLEQMAWEYIHPYFCDLPSPEQIKMLRYVLSLIATGTITLDIDELYRMFVGSEKKACYAVCGILWLLKKKIENPCEPINSSEFASIIGDSKIINEFNIILGKVEAKKDNGFYYDIGEFFYPCGGINKCHICRCGEFRDSVKHHVFYWCKKKACDRRNHFLSSHKQWQKYLFSDFLHILMKTDDLSTIWSITSEVSVFLNDIIESNGKEEFISHQLTEQEEIGEKSDNMEIEPDWSDNACI